MKLATLLLAALASVPLFYWLQSVGRAWLKKRDAEWQALTPEERQRKVDRMLARDGFYKHQCKKCGHNPTIHMHWCKR